MNPDNEKSISDRDQGGHVGNFYHLAILEEERGNYPGALKIYEDALSVSKKIGDMRTYVNTICLIARMYIRLEDYPMVIMQYEKMIMIYLEKGELSVRMNEEMTQRLDEIYNLTKTDSKSLEFFEDLNRIYSVLKDSLGKAKILAKIGAIHSNQGNHVRALKMFRRALYLFDEFWDLNIKAKILNYIGYSYKKLQNYSEAIKHYEEAGNLYEKLWDAEGKATVYINLGQAQKAQEKYKLALQYFEDALGILDKSEMQYPSKVKMLKKIIDELKIIIDGI